MKYDSLGYHAEPNTRAFASLDTATEPQPTRTFDRLNYAVERVSASRAQVEQMLTRINPSPPSGKLSDFSQGGGPTPYAISLDSLFGELDRLGHALDELASHI